MSASDLFDLGAPHSTLDIWDRCVWGGGDQANLLGQESEALPSFQESHHPEMTTTEQLLKWLQRGKALLLIKAKHWLTRLEIVSKVKWAEALQTSNYLRDNVRKHRTMSWFAMEYPMATRNTEHYTKMKWIHWIHWPWKYRGLSQMLNLTNSHLTLSP